MVALGAAVVPATPVAAADIGGTIVYHPSGSVVGTYVLASTNVATFSPSGNITAGSTIILTFPAGTALAIVDIVLGDFDITQAGGGIANPTNVVANAGAGTITFTVAGGSLSPSGLGNVIIATSGSAGADEIRHPTTVTATGAFTVATLVGDTGTINDVAFVAAAAFQLTITSAALNQDAGTQGTVTVEVQDQYGNPQTAGAYQVNLASNSTGTYQFYTTGTQNVITSINILGGASSGTFDYYDEKAGTPTITVTDNGGVLIQDSQQQTINAAATGIVTLASSTALLMAGGGSTATLTATVTDAFGNNRPDGTNVTFTTTLGSVGSATVTKTTTNGVATATLTSSTAAGPATVTATADGISATTTVSFYAPQGTAGRRASPGGGTVGGTQGQPPPIMLAYMNVHPQQILAGESVTITTNVVNTGGEAGNYNVVLKVNGQVEQTRMVGVGSQGTQPVKFTVTKDVPGTYTVTIGNQQSSFTVLGASSSGTTGSKTGALIALALIGTLIIATLVVLLLRRT